MIPVLKSSYDYFETFKGKRLVIVLVASFALFLLIGIMLGQFGDSTPKDQNIIPENTAAKLQTNQVEKVGKVVYVDPANYPNDTISYKLIDAKGKDIILLSASDDKLKFIEGVNAKLRGKIVKTKDGKNEVLFVEKIIFN